MADETAHRLGSKKLEGRIAIVTGAGSSGPGIGTGKAMSVLFAREGAQVVLVDKFEDRAKETLRLIEGEQGEAAVVTADLADVSACAQVVDEAVRLFGGLDILVNNAATASSTSLLDTPEELYQRIIAVNLTAPFFLTKAAIPVMAERGGGSIVNIISIAALRGQGGNGQAAYASAKSGLIGLMTDVADSYGKQGIRVNCVAPGIIDTVRSGRAPAHHALHAPPVGRPGRPEEIAALVGFLCGPNARYITGQTIHANGGVYM
jgi:NAD(P)-dependent dehydrogenase (short-subunit alcohol dehydrogenase family)